MKYQCLNDECNYVFNHPAKATEYLYNHPERTTHDEIPGSVSVTELTAALLSSIERYVCPKCQSIGFAEFVEAEAEVTSVKSVPLEEVDSWLVKGYKVKDLFSKVATLIMEAKP